MEKALVSLMSSGCSRRQLTSYRLNVKVDPRSKTLSDLISPLALEFFPATGSYEKRMVRLTRQGMKGHPEQSSPSKSEQPSDKDCG